MIAQISLVLCGLIVFRVTFPKRVVGAFAGLGAGLLIGAIAFDLVSDIVNLSNLEVVEVRITRYKNILTDIS